MNRILLYCLFIVGISIPPFISIFSTSFMPHTHDGPVHLARMAAYFISLGDFHIPVRWAGNLNYGYGMPLFNFMYQFPYMLSSLFIAAGIGLVAVFKIVLALSFILSGIFMFLFGYAFLSDVKKAMLVAIFYQFAPFRLVEIFVRGSFGEVFTYTFLPLTLLGLTLLFKKISYFSIVLTAAGTVLLVLSHNALSLVFFGICVLFTVVFGKDIRQKLFGLGSLALGLILAAFYWVPAIIEHKYTYGDLFMREMYLSHFPPFSNFFIPNLLNNEALQTEGIASQIGVFHTIAVVLGIIAILKWRLKGFEKKIVILALFLLATSFFFMQPISKLAWENISLLRQFQFPWRFLGIVIFASSLFSLSFFSAGFLKKTKIYILLIVLVVISTLYYWRPPLGFDEVDEDEYWNYTLNTTYFGETDLIWSAGPASSYPTERIEIIGGEAEVKDFFKKTQVHMFTLDAKTDVHIVDHTQYFPGWRVYVNGVQVPIQFQDPNFRGEITFNAPEGVSRVRVVFGESKVRLLSDLASLSGVIILGGLGISRIRKLYEV